MEGRSLCGGKFCGHVCHYFCECVDSEESKDFRFFIVWEETCLKVNREHKTITARIHTDYLKLVRLNSDCYFIFYVFFFNCGYSKNAI